MNLPFFIARRIYFSSDTRKQVAKPATRIATVGMALGLMVMLVSLSVVVGFKKEVRQKVTGIGGHVQISNLLSSHSYEALPIEAPDTLLAALTAIEGVAHVQRFATKPAMVKTADNFQGMVLKGIGQDYDTAFLAQHLVEGTLPHFTDSLSSQQLLLSRPFAQKLHLSLGDKLYAYFINERVKARRFTVVGIYETHFNDFDNLFAISDLRTISQLNGWERGEVSGIELSLDDDERADDTFLAVSTFVGSLRDSAGSFYCAQTVQMLFPQLFAWLDVLDMNVWIIFILMMGVAGFSMISGLLILILERTNMIGVLKALGTPDAMIRRVFLYFALFIVGKGMLWGNAIGLALCYVQQRWHLIRLNPADYYLDAVPISLTLPLWFALNLATLVVTLLILLAPSHFISQIRPAKSIRFE